MKEETVSTAFSKSFRILGACMMSEDIPFPQQSIIWWLWAFKESVAFKSWEGADTFDHGQQTSGIVQLPPCASKADTEPSGRPSSWPRAHLQSQLQAAPRLLPARMRKPTCQPWIQNTSMKTGKQRQPQEQGLIARTSQHLALLLP